MQFRSMSIAVAVLALGLALSCGRPVGAQSPPPTASPDAVAAARELVTASRAADQLKTLLPLIIHCLAFATDCGLALPLSRPKAHLIPPRRCFW